MKVDAPNINGGVLSISRESLGIKPPPQGINFRPQSIKPGLQHTNFEPQNINGGVRNTTGAGRNII
jgi:hypothetical protein